MDAIIPAAGQASRMRGIPKFLLPADKNYQTLIERHINHIKEYVKTIWIPVRPEFVFLLDSLNISGENIVIVPMSTNTMNESVGRVLEISSAETFMLVMPDTVFVGEQPYEALSKCDFTQLVCWRIREEQKGKLGQVLISDNQVIDMVDKNAMCDYEWSWGCLSFHRKLANYIDYQDPHIGYAVRKALDNNERIDSVKIRGKYFDCGTPSEYAQLVNSTFE